MEQTKKKGPDAPEGLHGAVRLVVKTFLEEDHIRSLHDILSEQWKSCHSLTAAMRLMEAHGVTITPEEEQELKELPEDAMIDGLLAKMPSQNQEQFEHFFLQLSLVASTTAKLRESLENGRPDVIEEALENAENVGIVGYLLKMAVVQGGMEVKTKEAEADAWCAQTRTRMAPMMKAQAANVKAQKLLGRAQALLEGKRLDAVDRTKTLLMGFATSSEDALLRALMASWDQITKSVKREREIRSEYEEGLQRAVTRLVEYKSKQLADIRQFMGASCVASTHDTLCQVFQVLRENAVASRETREISVQKAALEAKLATMSKSKNAIAKSVLARFADSNVEVLKHMAFASLVAHSAMSKVESQRENERHKKSSEILEAQKKCTKTQKGVLMRFVSYSDDLILQSTLNAWSLLCQDDKEAVEMKCAIGQKASKLDGFAKRNKTGAMTAMLALADGMERAVVFATLAEWRHCVRIERVKRYARDKYNNRRRQLDGVKGLFKNFASELDSGLQEPTPRVEPPPKR